jgi:hypothetical protein
MRISLSLDLQRLLIMLAGAGILKYLLTPLLADSEPIWLRLTSGLCILGFGARYPLTIAAEYIESSTDILSKKTHLAAGLLQSLGTAFPDMILGVTAAVVSLQLAASDPARAISYAMIAAATTFGSNIYNIGHAAWCIYRQNRADKVHEKVPMFPYIRRFGFLTPLRGHHRRPSIAEIDTAVRLLTILSLLTGAIALLMVGFGQVGPTLFQLIRPAGIGLLIITSLVLYRFRAAETGNLPEVKAAKSTLGDQKAHGYTVWLTLLAAGVAIAFTAESMVHALESLSVLTHIPYVVSGTLAGVIGCLGEMLVIHNYSIHASGRLGDAIVGVAMDNIVTIMGASIVAIMGGIFLGGTSLIVLFIVILTLNTLLIDQINILKSTLMAVAK